ncbi:glycosyltransferase family 4 protein [Bythopirellula polymerisocia]|uniref:Putative glycosyl transferase n=1 Tax=Bythopirellula polymerisocia TaxID=2528003 RepID=A0A5C6CUJ9_9BACT|nr:glycosyltransferase family 4 protein [Bythopirellula polymerisocia]TWU28088.1 putative glycosyl transferase [Bythopirellula polymerisocia]
MRFLIHDYAGHPFQVQMSRKLAARGHHVLHVYCASIHTPQGALSRQRSDPEAFQSEGIDLGEMIPKTGYRRRLQMEREYGTLLESVCQRFAPDVVISGNTPSIPQRRLVKYCQRNRIGHVFWVQDIYGLAAYKLLKRRVPLVGPLIGRYFIGLDKASARNSDALVVITEDFIPIFESWGLEKSRIHVVHNWAAIDDLPLRPRDNSWSQAQGMSDGPRFVYTGTMAMKHNPNLLLALAKMLDEKDSGEVMVVSEGIGVDWLKKESKEQGVRSLRFAGFQPFEVMADVLGSADVLIAVLEEDAGVFSVPSKILSYFCASRPVLAAMPLNNLAAKTIVKEGAGRVVASDDLSGFCSAASELIQSPELRESCGVAARNYAAEHFDIEQITTRFEEILQAAVPHNR